MEKTVEQETAKTFQRTRMVVMAAAFAALACVATMVVKVPSPTGGYMNLGDTVVLLSDGITDADAVGLEALLCRFQSQDQQELADTVLAYAKAHTPADRRDDMSVIVARLLPN